ncbi:mucin-7-like [Sorghum bicolor]|uniref:mucin-7-like n=1 Tax=Sorghum bicolor TaxID=4558 RepID=UPI000B42641C|nr:mucin-7-like [Sorghum bicolor]|eukprot:XP_021309130.1 mucin-7-like [Sorghum bicolor]
MAKEWKKSRSSARSLNDLVGMGLLHSQELGGWRAPEGESYPEPRADNSFVRSGDRIQAFKLGRPAPKIGDVDRCAVYISLVPGMENPAGVDPPEVDAARAASNVDPDHVAGQRAAEPVAAVGDAPPQTTEQPAATTTATSTEEHPAPASATASTPTRNEEAARTPPPSNVVEEESRALTPPGEERGVPTPPRAGNSSPVGSPGLDQGPVMPATTAGGSSANEETRTASDDDVEEIQVDFKLPRVVDH